MFIKISYNKFTYFSPYRYNLINHLKNHCHHHRLWNYCSLFLSGKMSSPLSTDSDCTALLLKFLVKSMAFNWHISTEKVKQKSYFVQQTCKGSLPAQGITSFTLGKLCGTHGILLAVPSSVNLQYRFPTCQAFFLLLYFQLSAAWIILNILKFSFL